ncbi:transposition [Fragilaria crotonensis]|nr:transposition [Fragilaria crotonensis]
MIVLFNPGRTSSSYIKRSVLPVGATPALHDVERKATTLGGETMSNLSVRAQNITLPEFSKSIRVDHHVFWVHDNENVRYDAIIGRDLLRELKLDICYSDGTMKMEGRVLLMKRRGETPTFYINDEEDEDDSYAVEIKDAKYKKVKIDDVIEQQKHLSSVQRQQLRSAYWGNDHLFDSKLKKYTGKKIRLELKEDAHPIHCTKPFPVPQTQVAVFKKECERLCNEDVLAPVGAMEHAYYHTFIIPKKDRTVRWVSDLRKLNQNLRRRIYPCLEFRMSFIGVRVISISQRSISRCVIVPLSSTMRERNFA